ncbi:hypothetical protein [Hyphomicrobium sp. CS1GBMeth3]|uniref:hypothetical protein n=1 Tax=Hyphomicrobium sp. CS1GBMeth3 TaxID=1892845 RepID=UPI001114EA2F|nr:hypothetical protein [Hyphomicrobium sp. CS1GBMeth3]
MSKVAFVALSALGLALAATAATAPPAAAKIACKDGFQLSGGNWISTPYCNDEYLAQIARKHGAKVSGNEVRSNPNTKYEVCRFLSGSPAARDYCPDEGGRGRR